MSDLVEVKVDSLRVSLTNQQRIIVLKQIDDDRYLPIWIGPFESEAITIALQEVEISRPQTHDLVKNAITLMDGEIKNVLIKDLQDDIFFGSINIESEGKKLELDSRPSDAIAIAIRAHVPILVAKKVMEEASIVPEEINPDDIPEEAGEPEKFTYDQMPSNQDRLSIFADYLNKNGPDEQQPDNKEDTDDDIDDEIKGKK